MNPQGSTLSGPTREARFELFSQNVHGLEERIQDLKEVSNKSLQYATDLEAIKIGADLSIAPSDQWPDSVIVEPGVIKAAGRLGNLFSPYDVPTVYRMLGIQKL